MLNNISWTSYWTIIGITLFLYYAGICFRYYLVEVKQILSGKLKLNLNKKISNDLVGISSQQDFLSTISQFKQEITVILKEAAEKNFIKQELMYSLQLLFKKYSTIKDGSFEMAINDYLFIECPKQCSIHLDEEEVMSLWVK
jgi:hypothetical protein